IGEPTMPMPSPARYSAAIQAPDVCFSDPELAKGRPEADQLFGLPLAFSGAHAFVYKVRCDGDRARAVKCFIREAPERQKRYQLISEHLEANKRKFAVPFKYLAEGIKVDGAWHPVVKMHWVEGLTLNEFLRAHADNAVLLEQLAALWLRLATEMGEARMAHG